MEKVTFISAPPYLTLRFKELSKSVQFIKHCYSTEDPTEIQLLREYTKINPVTVAEAGVEKLEELIKRYNEAEDKMILEAEEREKARKAEEERKKEEHEFFSALRMADKVYM